MRRPRPLRTPFHAAIGFLLLAAAGPVFALGTGELCVTSDASNQVRTYVDGTGVYAGNLTTSVAALGELGIHFGATNNRVLVGHFGLGVEEFDATTGAYIKTYNPGGGWMWSGIYAPSGDVLVASSATDQILRFDPNTAAPLGVWANVPGGPADMEYGPNGNLYVCAFNGGMVFELNGLSGAIVTAWPVPPGNASFVQPNDVAFLNGEILVTVMGANLVHRYDSTPVHNLLGTFAGTGWGNPHGIAIGPTDGRIYVADGVSTQVHVFDPLTFVELDPAFLSPGPGDKIVDLAFRPSLDPTPSRNTTWGRLKSLYR